MDKIERTETYTELPETKNKIESKANDLLTSIDNEQKLIDPESDEGKSQLSLENKRPQETDPSLPGIGGK